MLYGGYTPPPVVGSSGRTQVEASLCTPARSFWGWGPGNLANLDLGESGSVESLFDTVRRLLSYPIKT